MAPWFFLSYGRRDDVGDAYVSLFYEKLVEVVAKKAGLPSEVKPEEIGFFDQSDVLPGDRWSDKIAEALRTCRTFVCLLSPSYLASEYCGKEFAVFQERMENKGTKPPLILPILWDWPEKVRKNLPRVISQIQFAHKSFGDTYATEGLSYLVRRGEHGDFIDKFAIHIVSVADTKDLLLLE